jgi:hypothetical protein
MCTITVLTHTPVRDGMSGMRNELVVRRTRLDIQQAMFESAAVALHLIEDAPRNEVSDRRLEAGGTIGSLTKGLL